MEQVPEEGSHMYQLRPHYQTQRLKELCISSLLVVLVFTCKYSQSSQFTDSVFMNFPNNKICL